MHEFDSYIKSIINNLTVSNKKKNELYEEFKDHLEMLKKEYINNGFSENDAVREAISNFGSNILLNKKLSDTLTGYRTIPIILFGITFHLILFIIGSHIPIGFNEPYDYLYISLIAVIGDIPLFSPLGYFLPILFRGMRKVTNLVLISILLGMLIGIYLVISSKDLASSKGLLLLICAIASVPGSLIGFFLLKMISKVSQVYKSILYKRS